MGLMVLVGVSTREGVQTKIVVKMTTAVCIAASGDMAFMFAEKEKGTRGGVTTMKIVINNSIGNPMVTVTVLEEVDPAVVEIQTREININCKQWLQIEFNQE